MKLVHRPVEDLPGRLPAAPAMQDAFYPHKVASRDSDQIFPPQFRVEGKHDIGTPNEWSSRYDLEFLYEKP